ncbi:MAG: gluconate:H+ symporter [Cyclobacteriaceae bacterium]|nr:gluconate:H+ symporter [Cyclobacteriaceae bacterium]
MPILIVAVGVLLLLLLITVFKLNAFIAFILVSIFIGLSQGLTLEVSLMAFERGIGDTLGSLILILGLGAMLGKIIADSGAAQQITSSLVQLFGKRRVQFAMMLAGFLVGLPMFYSVGFVILVPLVFTVAASLGMPLLVVALPMLAALSVTHGYLPPHPAPTAIIQMFKGDVGLTLIYGLIVSIPAILISGFGSAKLSKGIVSVPLKDFVGKEKMDKDHVPSPFISIFCAILPVFLIAFSSLAEHFLAKENILRIVLTSLGMPSMAMLIAVLTAIYFLEIRQGRKMKDVMTNITKGVSSITMVLLVIGAAGGLKEILVESKVNDYIASLMVSSTVNPLILAWATAALIRVCVGSATIAGLTAAGIMEPMVGHGVSPELLTLAIGAGSIMLSHVNDSGFWLFKEYFNLSIKDTFRTWTLMETSIAITGIIGVLILDIFV